MKQAVIGLVLAALLPAFAHAQPPPEQPPPTVTYAAAALLLAAHGAPVTLDSVQPQALAGVKAASCPDPRGNHITIRWRGWHPPPHHRRHRRGR